MSIDVAEWLKGLGLERYEPAFRENEIDWEALPKPTAEDLKDLGVVLGGHRRRLLDAIAALDAPEASPLATAAASASVGEAERAQADRDVMRSGRLDAAVDALRSRGSARDRRCLPPLRRRHRRPF
jgi:hypothetical protein